MSDVELECERIPLESDLRGWWAKLELFKQSGPVLYLDLDTAVVGNCDALLEAVKGQEFVILRDFYRGNYNKKAMGSGLMYWEGDMSYIWRIARETNPMREAPCDQTWLEKVVKRAAYFQDFTKGVLSYKADVLNGADWRNAEVVCFHGTPRPWQQKEIPGWQ